MSKIYIVNYLGTDCYIRDAVPIKGFSKKKYARKWISKQERFWEYDISEVKFIK